MRPPTVPSRAPKRRRAAGHLLRERGVNALDVVGIATDYCVRATALDAARQGFTTRVLLGLTEGVDPVTTAEALGEMGRRAELPGRRGSRGRRGRLGETAK